MAFANAEWAAELCRLGTSCPDHFLRTRISPLFVPWAPPDGSARLREQIRQGLEQYRAEYVAYYEAHAVAGSPALRDSNPSVVVIPGLVSSICKDSARPDHDEFLINAIHVDGGARRGGDASGGASELSKTWRCSVEPFAARRSWKRSCAHADERD